MTKKRLAVLNIVGLSQNLLGANTPNINRYIGQNSVHAMHGVFPALTTTAQSSMLTGLYPDEHGIVGNGWYDRDFAEVAFWKQPNQLVQGEKVWDRLRTRVKDFTCSQLFWWYNMYANVEASITPRPHYPADGRKIIDLYSTPNGLHQSIEKEIGKFPFFNFWGPKAGIESSKWIAKSAMCEADLNAPNLQFVYLPHLDYCLQKFGPNHISIPEELQAIDGIVGELLDYYQARDVGVMIVSEYGISEVDTPVHLNRILRENGYLHVRQSLTWELLDPGASDAFAVADHQIAHIYIRDTKHKTAVKALLENTPGVERVLDDEEKQTLRANHQRAGNLIVIAEKRAWFTYYYWLDDAKAPDFARSVDIHRKPGYDPVEMFVDPKIRFPMLKVIWRLIQKKLGFRMLMDVIPLDATLIKGSHGRPEDTPAEGALTIMPKSLSVKGDIEMVKVAQLIEQYFHN
ncbi:MAG: putative AlkP superfamily pyrophosphatase or phosphodiesterase [Flavobacteriales bacterium]|jgi:predicted AlkP superfamily pyrophosphatase or phosphodiesterase